MASSADYLDSLPSFSQPMLTVTDDAPHSPASEPSDGMASPPTPNVLIKLDPDFYFDGVFVVFQVEDTLFRVPSNVFFNESEIFAKEFNLPTLNNSSGTTPTIALPADIRREDFRNLLKALFPSPVLNKLSLSQSEWISVLELSTKWCFNNLRKTAILELESLKSLTSMNKVVFGRQYSVSSWLLSGLTDFASRREIMTDDDVSVLGYETTFALFKVRELKLWEKYDELHRRYREGYGYSNDGHSDSGFSVPSTMAAISSAFEPELLAMKKEERKFESILFDLEDLVPSPEMPVKKGLKKGKGKK